ncbi:uncharacterized protein DS421_20g703580 [Arachis hypogaea]|nr:uncharacterized protein DS421_20g703580 [Arachis hypogaea]
MFLKSETIAILGDRRGIVTIGAEQPFLLVEFMEMMLMRACSMLRIGCPIFLAQETKALDSVIRFGYTVVLPSNDRGLELVAHGPVSVNDHDARQEVSFVMLEKLMSTTGLAICDYNYRIICRLKHERNEENTKVMSSLSERIRQLEEENADLKRQVEMFEELVEE